VLFVINIDFLEARERRREILHILKDQQAEDAVCLDQIKAVAIEGKRSLLHALARWLSSIRPGQAITKEIRNAFRALGTGLTAEDWQMTQTNYDDAEARLKEAAAEEAKAQAEYDRVAPWGVVSSFFADDGKKGQIEPIKVRRDQASQNRQKAQAAMETPRHLLNSRSERLLRAISSPEQLQIVCRDPQIAPNLLPIIQETASKAGSLWITHSRKHVSTSAKMEGAVRQLQGYYNGASASAALLSQRGGVA